MAFLLRPGALPNLETLDTGPRFCLLEPCLLHRMLYSPTLRKLHLRAATPMPVAPRTITLPQSSVPKAMLDRSSSSVTYSRTARRQPANIEVLELDLSGSQREGPYWWDVSSLLADVLDLCAPSLQELRLRCLHGGCSWGGEGLLGSAAGAAGFRIELPGRREVPQLPRLELLYVDRLAPLAQSFLAPLLEQAPALRTLVVDASDEEVRRAVVGLAGRHRSLPSVRNVVWYGGGGGGSSPCTLPDDLDAAVLLRPFTGMDGFRIGGGTAVTASVAARRVLPIFVCPKSSRFGTLTKLSLAFDERDVTRCVLAQIGGIITLESLHLRAATTGMPPRSGGGTVPRPRATTTWVVRHSVVRRHLAGLRRLAALIFEGEDYLMPGHERTSDGGAAYGRGGDRGPRASGGAGHRRYYAHY
ncbi:hypothetical protein RB594_007708 [Gaeumannomyces avenae]